MVSLIQHSVWPSLPILPLLETASFVWTCRRNIENIRVGDFEHLNELELTLLPFLKLTFYHSREEPWDSLVAKESQFLTKSAVSTLSWPRLHLCLNFLMKFSWRLGSVILSFQPKTDAWVLGECFFCNSWGWGDLNLGCLCWRH